MVTVPVFLFTAFVQNTFLHILSLRLGHSMDSRHATAEEASTVERNLANLGSRPLARTEMSERASSTSLEKGMKPVVEMLTK